MKKISKQASFIFILFTFVIVASSYYTVTTADDYYTDYTPPTTWSLIPHFIFLTMALVVLVARLSERFRIKIGLMESTNRIPIGGILMYLLISIQQDILWLVSLYNNKWLFGVEIKLYFGLSVVFFIMTVLEVFGFKKKNDPPPEGTAIE